MPAGRCRRIRVQKCGGGSGGGCRLGSGGSLARGALLLLLLELLLLSLLRTGFLLRLGALALLIGTARGASLSHMRSGTGVSRVSLPVLHLALEEAERAAGLGVQLRIHRVVVLVLRGRPCVSAWT
jgi:hypothetical protein